MYVLFETPAGYALFKLQNEKKLEQIDNLYEDFSTPEAASKILKLKHFEKFADTTAALEATTAATEGSVCKALKKMLKKHCDEQLAVADAKLGSAIKEKLSLNCISNTAIQELMRCIRSQSESLLAGLEKKEMTAMALGLAHSLSRYKLKFSPDKVDTMIIQAVCLLDDLDKELNNYVMRTREWYGWHFPELGKIVTDNIAFVKTVKIIGTRNNAIDSDLSDILPEEIEEQVKEAAEKSTGCEISDADIMNIEHLCDQVIDISHYRGQLYDYLVARMTAIAPGLTAVAGELVGARLIANAGSLMNLAKHASSTVQILGAEKALFRALKTKRDTPKYGLIYHSQSVGQASTKHKGTMSRVTANNISKAVRVDAFGEDTNSAYGIELRAKIEMRLRMLEEGNMKRLSGTGKAKAKLEKYHSKSEFSQYPAATDSTMPKKRTFDEVKSEPEPEDEPSIKKKRHQSDPAVEIKEEDEEAEVPAEPAQKKKKNKKAKQEINVEESSMDVTVEAEPEQTTDEKQKKKKKKNKEIKQEEEKEEITAMDVTAEAEPEQSTDEKKKKKKKKVKEEVTEETIEEAAPEPPTSEKKKKKKKKSESND